MTPTEVACRDSFTEMISISTLSGSPLFMRLARLSGISRIRALSGSMLCFALYNEVSIPCVVDWTCRKVSQFREMPDVAVRRFELVSKRGD